MRHKLAPGWRWVELGDVCSLQSGSTPARNNNAYWGGTTPWITAKDMKRLRISTSQITLTSAGREVASLAPAGTVLILTRGMGLFKDVPIGLLNQEAAFNQDIKALRPSEGMMSGYLAAILQASRPRLMSMVDAAGHGTGRLSTDRLIALPIPVPQEQVQAQIASFLFDHDQGVSATTALISAKKSYKTALMQLLLRDGEPHRLPYLARISFSGVDKRSFASELPVRLCNYMDVFANATITADLPLMNATATLAEVRRFELKRGDVLFTKDSETAEDIAESAYVPHDLPDVVCGYHLALARPDPEVIRGDFLAHAMKAESVRTQFRRVVNGVVRFGLTLDALDQIEIRVPTLARQASIAGALTALDDEIDLLTSQVDALHRQKRGLMRKLLTGQWGVPGPIPHQEAAE